MARYFFTPLAGRPLTLSGHVFKFMVIGISGGKASGVYEAKTDEEIAILSDAVRARRGIAEISLEEWEKSVKKTAQIRSFRSSNGSSPHVVQIPLLPQSMVEAAPGVASAGLRSDGSQKPAEELPPSPSIGSLLRIAKVHPPKPFAASDEKTKKSSVRADRAKIRVARRNAA